MHILSRRWGHRPEDKGCLGCVAREQHNSEGSGWCRELGAELGGPIEDTEDVEELVLKCHSGSVVHREQGVPAVTQEAHTKVRRH